MSDSSMEKLTHSSMRQAATCLRKYFLRQRMKLVSPDDAQALRFGSAFHLGLEKLAGGLALEEALDAVQRKGDVEDYDLAKLIALLTCYVGHWKDHPLKFIAAEWSFDVPLRNPRTGASSRTFTSAGKVDGILEDDWIIEHKTTAFPIDSGSAYWDRLQADQQLSQYMLALQEYNQHCNGAMYDVIRKPAQRPTKVPILDQDGFKQVIDQDGNRVYSKKQVPELDGNGIKIVLDQDGNRVFGKNGKPRQTGDKDLGYTLKTIEVNGKPRQSEDRAQGWFMMTRLETPEEYAERLIDLINEDPAKYFQRKPIRRTHDELRTYATERWVLGQGIKAARNMESDVDRPQDAWPRNIGQATCDLFKCPYRELCFTNRTIEEGKAPEGFVTMKPHKELEDE